MTQGQGILQCVLDNPEDDTPRLVYADWLDDHGEPDRAEFIRIQIELARLAHHQVAETRLAYITGDAGYFWDRIESVLAQVAIEEARLAHGRYPELKRREAELLEAHGEDWAEPLRPFVPDHLFAPRLMFRRGFIERVQLESAVLAEQGAALFRLAPIVEIKLEGHFEGTEPIPEALALPDLGRLTALGISASEDGSVMAALADARHLCRLSWLALEGLVGDAEAQVLANLPHLASLTDLHLEHNNIQPAGMAALAASPHFRRLTSLYLGWNRIGNEGLAHLLASPLLERLTTLDLCWNHFGGSPHVTAFLGSPRLAGLTTLYLDHNFNLQPEEVQVLAQSPHLRRLATLDLIETPLVVDHARELAASSALTQLTTLNLGRTFGDGNGTEAAEVLAGSPTLGRLAALNLCSNDIFSPGAVALASSPHMANLVWLHLGDNEIDFEGAFALAGSPTLTALTELNVDGNKINEAGVEALRRRFGEGVRI